MTEEERTNQLFRSLRDLYRDEFIWRIRVIFSFKSIRWRCWSLIQLNLQITPMRFCLYSPRGRCLPPTLLWNAALQLQSWNPCTPPAWLRGEAWKSWAVRTAPQNQKKRSKLDHLWEMAKQTCFILDCFFEKHKPCQMYSDIKVSHWHWHQVWLQFTQFLVYFLFTFQKCWVILCFFIEKLNMITVKWL